MWHQIATPRHAKIKMNPVYTSDAYLRNKAIHERTCAEIVRPKRMYAVINNTDNSVQLMSKTTLAQFHITSFMEPGQRFASDNKKERFINQWLEDPDRLVCRSVVVDPTLPVGPSVRGFNLWPGFAASSIPAVLATDVDTLLRPIILHIDEVYAGHSAGKREWILNWFAHNVQFPGRRHGVAIVIHGEPETGRGVLGKFHRMVTGADVSYHAMFCKKYQHLESVLNGDAMQAFVQMKRQPKLHKRASALLAKRTVEFKQKYFGSTYVQNLTNLYITTQDQGGDSGVDSFTDEKFAVFTARPTYKDNHPYFNQLWEQLRRPEVQRAWFQYLMARDLSQFAPGSLPPTV